MHRFVQENLGTHTVGMQILVQLIQYNACFMKVQPPQYSLNLQVCDPYILCACTPASASMIFSMVLLLMSTNETFNSTVGGTCIYNLRIIPSFLMIPNSSIAPKIVSVRMQPPSICTHYLYPAAKAFVTVSFF